MGLFDDVTEQEPTREQLAALIEQETEECAAFTWEAATQAGVNRFPHSAEMEQFYAYWIDQAEREGIAHFRDSFGNVYFYLLPDNMNGVTRVVAAGSHGDSVPTGANTMAPWAVSWHSTV